MVIEREHDIEQVAITNGSSWGIVGKLIVALSIPLLLQTGALLYWIGTIDATVNNVLERQITMERVVDEHISLGAHDVAQKQHDETSRRLDIVRDRLNRNQAAIEALRELFYRLPNRILNGNGR